MPESKQLMLIRVSKNLQKTYKSLTIGKRKTTADQKRKNEKKNEGGKQCRKDVFFYCSKRILIMLQKLNFVIYRVYYS